MDLVSQHLSREKKQFSLNFLIYTNVINIQFVLLSVMNVMLFCVSLAAGQNHFPLWMNKVFISSSNFEYQCL